jgi:tetratricopeptide (TPR) repeat protein
MERTMTGFERGAPHGKERAMISRIKPMSLFWFLVAVTIGVFMISCGPKAQHPHSRLDTPEHHTFTGIRLMNQEKFVDAGREFELALRLDPGYARAHVGIGLVRAYQSDFSGGIESLKQAEKHIRSDEEKIFIRVGYIRLNTLSYSACLRIGTECKPDDNWLKESKDAFDRAVLIDPKAAAAHYFMGEAYLTAVDLDQAGRMFSRVLDLNGEYVKEADGRLKQVQKIQRAIK